MSLDLEFKIGQAELFIDNKISELNKVEEIKHANKALYGLLSSLVGAGMATSAGLVEHPLYGGGLFGAGVTAALIGASVIGYQLGKSNGWEDGLKVGRKVTSETYQQKLSDQ